MFFDWLVKHRDDDSPVGDFTRDAEKDHSFPRSDDYDELAEYLERRGASFSATEAFERAYTTYRQKEAHSIGKLD